MTPLPWFRVYSEILHDKKLKRVAAVTHQPRVVVIGIWLMLLAYANESPLRGDLMISEDLPLTMDEIASDSGLDESVLSTLFAQFRELQMLNGSKTFEIKNWDKRQFKSDNSTVRSRKAREREAPEPLPEEKPKPIPKKPAPKPEEPKNWVPTALYGLCKAFSESANIPIPKDVDKDWLKSLHELAELGVDEQMVITAVKRLRNNKMVITRPGAVMRTIVSMQANQKVVTRIDADGNAIIETV